MGEDDHLRTAQCDQDLYWDDDLSSDDPYYQDDDYEDDDYEDDYDQDDDDPPCSCDTCQGTGDDDPCPWGCGASVELVGSPGMDVVWWVPGGDEPPF